MAQNEKHYSLHIYLLFKYMINILVENHLAKRCEVCLVVQVLLHPCKALREHLRRDVGIVGAIEQMVGGGDSEEYTDDLGRVCAGKVVVEGTEVGLVVNVAHDVVGLHDGGRDFMRGMARGR